jgi:hypothetical protein
MRPGGDRTHEASAEEPSRSNACGWPDSQNAWVTTST